MESRHPGPGTTGLKQGGPLQYLSAEPLSHVDYDSAVQKSRRWGTVVAVIQYGD